MRHYWAALLSVTMTAVVLPAGAAGADSPDGPRIIEQYEEAMCDGELALVTYDVILHEDEDQLGAGRTRTQIRYEGTVTWSQGDTDYTSSYQQILTFTHGAEGGTEVYRVRGQGRGSDGSHVTLYEFARGEVLPDGSLREDKYVERIHCTAGPSAS